MKPSPCNLTSIELSKSKIPKPFRIRCLEAARTSQRKFGHRGFAETPLDHKKSFRIVWLFCTGVLHPAFPILAKEIETQAVLFRPVLSADGKRLAVVELGPKAAPSRILLYELPRPTLVMELDVRGADDAGPVWVANPPTG